MKKTELERIVYKGYEIRVYGIEVMFMEEWINAYVQIPEGTNRNKLCGNITYDENNIIGTDTASLMGMSLEKKKEEAIYQMKEAIDSLGGNNGK
jgi:VIT1/CCC1 family predicted Fe2+/Mn2+ transporter